MKHLRGGSGLGDSLYVRVVAEELIRQGHKVTAYTDYPDVFIGVTCRVESFGRTGINCVAHYTAGKQNPATSQWDDVCDSAQVPRVPFGFTWNVINSQLVSQVKEQARGRPVVLIHGGRAPMNRVDNFGIELLPEKQAFDRVQEAIRREVFLVRIGEGTQKYPLDRVELDLWGKTSVADLIDLASICDALVAPCSFVVPLAEAFDKPLLAIWAASGLYPARHPYIKSITPRKVLAKPSSSFVMDDWNPERITAAAAGFVDSLNKAPAVRFIDFEDVKPFFKDKRVALAGSAPSILDNAAGFIESYDVIVRINNHKCGPAQGFRTDVFYSFFGTSIKKSAVELKHEGVKLMMCKCPDDKPIASEWHERNGKTAGIDFTYIYQNRKSFWFCDTFIPTSKMFMEKFQLLNGHIPTTGFSALLDVLSCEPKSLYLTGFDFFSSGVHNVDEKWRPGDPGDPIGHRPQLELEWLIDNQKRYPLAFDARLAEIIKQKRGAIAA